MSSPAEPRVASAPEPARQLEGLQRKFRGHYAGESPRYLVNVPLRLCPLGAHSDHQGGKVTGYTIDRHVTLAFAPAADPHVTVHSGNFDGVVSFSLQNIPPKEDRHWGNYARGAASALQDRQRSRGAPPLTKGLAGVVTSSMPIGGLSSSAAVTLAYLTALQLVNEVRCEPAENVNLVLATENRYLGLNNGILDQGVIAWSQRNCLTAINCATQTAEALAAHPAALPYETMVVYSGLSRNLLSTPFNQRVQECRQAAERLLHHAGRSRGDEARLGHVPREVYEQHREALDEPLRRRADHFFTEQSRVEAGISAWKNGQIAALGRLISESGHSSIQNYESGSKHLVALYELLSSIPGVYGARFCGGGFNGCALALIDPARRGAIIEQLREYPREFPEVQDDYSIHFCESAGSIETVTL